MRVKTAISLGFRIAAARYPDVRQRWVTASIRLGSQLPHSILIASVQRCGEIDLLLRAMEDEPSPIENIQESDVEFSAFNYQLMISEDWIGNVYEITRLRRERQLVPEDSSECAIARVLHILRMPLDKHEIANGPGLKQPLHMQRNPPNGDASDLYVYDRNDPKRAHIMPRGLSERGSMMWHAIDGATLQGAWFERRAISDALLDVWAPLTVSTDEAPTSPAGQ
jgi:hypothetical protein